MTYQLKDMEGANVLITGGLGFTGSNLAHKLVSLNADVVIFDACLDPYGWNMANLGGIEKKVKFVKGDVRDIDILKQHVKDKDFIFDCAAQVSHLLSNKNPLLDLDINCRGALNILESARQSNSDATLVYASTRGVVGRPLYTPIDEKHPTNPPDIYSVDKLAAERYYLLYNRLHGIKASVLRLTNYFGERCNVRREDYNLVNWWIRQALMGEQIVLHGDGSIVRDYCYVQDIADSLIVAAQNGKSIGEVFMVGSGKGIAIKDIVSMVLKTVGSSMKINFIPQPKERKLIEVGNVTVSHKKIKEALGWYPKTSLEEGIKNTVEFYKSNIKKYA